MAILYVDTGSFEQLTVTNLTATTSSISYISQSTLNIGTNLITVNTNIPSVRFGGLAVIDSGSSPQRSGSILFDSTNDQWIFVHQASATATSSLFIMGPETYGSIGNETNLTNNRIPKSVNAEHIGDSNITDTGNIIQLGSATQITGSLLVSTSITASIFSGSFTGSLFGTSSWATNAVTASTADAFTIRGNLTVSGSTTIGDATTDSIIMNAATMSLGSGTGILNIDSNTFVVDGANNRVGILKNNPSTTLDVNGNTIVTGSIIVTNGVTGSLQGNADTATSAAGVNMSAQTADNNYNILFSTGNGNGRSVFHTQNITTTFQYNPSGSGIFTANATLNAANNTLAVDKPNSRVGILKSNPSTTLDVNGNTTISGSLILSGSSHTIIGTLNATSSWASNAVTTLGPVVSDGSSNSLVSTTTQTFTGVKNFSGNVNVKGAGGAPIFTVGATSATQIRTGSGAAGINPIWAMAGNVSSLSTGQYLNWDETNQWTLSRGNGTSQIIRVAIQLTNNTDTAAAEASDLTFLTKPTNGAITERLRITGAGDTILSGSLIQSGSLSTASFSGNVGIGTIAPSSKLQVTAGTLVASTNNYALNVTATMPTTYAYRPQGVNIVVTSAGSQTNASYPQEAIYVQLASGYTGGTSTRAIFCENAAAGTAGTIVNSGTPIGNSAMSFSTVGTTTGNNYGVSGFARLGNTSIGGLFRAGYQTANDNKTGAKYIGCVGIARNDTGVSSVSLGGYFGLNQNSDPTFANAALIADNSDAAYDIFVARDNGTAVFTIQDGGSVSMTGSLAVSGSLTLTSGSVTMPNRSAFRVYGSSVTGIPATTTISGSATTVDYNQGNNYNNTTGVYTAPVAGLYSVYYNGRTNSGATQQVIIYKNSTTSSLMWETTGSNSGHFGVSSILNLAVNDTLRATVTVGTIQFDSNDNWGAAYIG